MKVMRQPTSSVGCWASRIITCDFALRRTSSWQAAWKTSANRRNGDSLVRVVGIGEHLKAEEAWVKEGQAGGVTRLGLRPPIDGSELKHLFRSVPLIRLISQPNPVCDAGSVWGARVTDWVLSLIHI